MARFQFRLATVLKLREAARDERRGHLAEAYLAEQKLRERRQTIEAELEQLKQHCQGAATPGQTLDLERLVGATRFEAVLRVEMQIIRQHEATLAVEIEKRVQAVVAADREVRVLEKLRETKRDRFRQEEALAEIKQLDEVAGRQADAANREVAI